MKKNRFAEACVNRHDKANAWNLGSLGYAEFSLYPFYIYVGTGAGPIFG